MARRFRMNAKIRSELSRQPEFRAMLLERAGRVKDQVERNSPIGETQNFIYSIRIKQYPTMVRVYSTDYFAHLIEWGSANNPPYAPFRRGVTAAGLRLDEQPPGGSEPPPSIV